MPQPLPAPDPERSRLIDHFKRAYQIIVGLSITLACTKLFPGGTPNLTDTSFWLFCIFFITVVPIFHGGDRSLDVKYLRAAPVGWARAAYVWDVYMLLITAILFVKIAQAIPTQGAPGQLLGAAQSAATPQLFYRWMMIMLIIDVIILLVDAVKTAYLYPDSDEKLSSYLPWILLNSALALVCWWASSPPEQFTPGALAFFVFLCALIRTIADYCFGRDFLFP